MANLDWHADRADLGLLAQLDNTKESEDINLSAVRQYRLNRVRKEMVARDIDALILSDPVNIRYTTGTRNMQIFSARNTPSRYLLLTQNNSILYEFTGCMHLAEGYETISEIRPALTASFVAAGPDIAQCEKTWAKEMMQTITQLVGEKPIIGMERMNAGAALALHEKGGRLVDAQETVEIARSIKSDEEMKCIVASLRATEIGVGKLQAAIRPGLSENALWSILHQTIIALNGDYVETRLLNSGNRTNPWFQETSSKTIGDDELVALDTDVVGCHGYYADFSRTFHAGPNKPTKNQRTLYQIAYEQIQYNLSILKAGMSFREYSEKAWDIPKKYHANRYYLSAHGVGMTGEYPYLYHRSDFPEAGYDGELQAGMTICIESYIGEEDGHEGVKLEEQVLIKESGIELLSKFPFEKELLRV